MERKYATEIKYLKPWAFLQKMKDLFFQKIQDAQINYIHT